jgi:excisionase family DNA binding protein
MERKSLTDTLLTVRQAAQRLGIAERTCWTWLYARRVPVTRLGNRCVRIPSGALEKMIAEATIPADEERQ